MSVTLGQFSANGRLEVQNPANPLQVRQFSGSGSPQWVNKSSATYSETYPTLVQIGTTGAWSVASGLPDGNYVVWRRDIAATAFTDSVLEKVLCSTDALGFTVESVTGAVGSVAGDVSGKVLGGGSSTITAEGVRPEPEGAFGT